MASATALNSRLSFEAPRELLWLLTRQEPIPQHLQAPINRRIIHAQQRLHFGTRGSLGILAIAWAGGAGPGCVWGPGRFHAQYHFAQHHLDDAGPLPRFST